MIKASLAFCSTIPQVRIPTQITQYARCRQEQSSTRHTSSSALGGAGGEEEGKPVPFFIPFASFAYSARVRSVPSALPSIFSLPRSSLTRCKPRTAGITVVSGSSGAIYIHKECKLAHARRESRISLSSPIAITATLGIRNFHA